MGEVLTITPENRLGAAPDDDSAIGFSSTREIDERLKWGHFLVDAFAHPFNNPQEASADGRNVLAPTLLGLLALSKSQEALLDAAEPDDMTAVFAPIGHVALNTAALSDARLRLAELVTADTPLAPVISSTN